MKIDQEMLIKQRFWVLLGLSLPLVLVALLLLTTSVASAIQQERDAVDKAKKSLEGIKDPKNQKHVDKLKAVDDQIAGKKNLVHEKAWRNQSSLMTWPAELASKMQNAHFGDPLGTFERSDYVDRTYTTQLWDIYHIIQPVNTATGEGAVQYKGAWQTIIQPIDRWLVSPPSNEDVWLAQEDLWVRRELLRVARNANDLVGVFRGPKAPEKPFDKAKLPKGEELVDHKVFTNPYWEVELTLTKNVKNNRFLRGTIKNISERRHPLGMFLLVRLQKDTSAPVAVGGEPLATGESTRLTYTEENKPVPVDRYGAQGLYGVEQVFDWKTAPVKRVDAIALGYPAHRVSNRRLKPYPGFAPKAEDGTEAGGGIPAGGGVPPTGSAEGTPGPGGMPGGMMPGGMLGGGQTANVTENGLVKDRYIDVTASVRRMPVGLILTVDQAHVQEVLTAFANSRLRIQTTQVHWQRSYDNLRPLEAGASALAGGGELGSARGLGGRGSAFTGSPEGGGVAPPAPPGAGGLMGRMGGGGFGGMIPGGLRGGLFGSLQNTEEEDELSLVEVTLYGTASLYERYPPKQPPAAPDAGNQDGKPATPPESGAPAEKPPVGDKPAGTASPGGTPTEKPPAGDKPAGSASPENTPLEKGPAGDKPPGNTPAGAAPPASPAPDKPPAKGS